MEDKRSHKYKHIKEQAKAANLKRSRRANIHRKPAKKTEYLVVKPTIWDDIVSEDREFENFIRKEKLKNIPKFECHSGYLKRELFPQLIPAFERICLITLIKSAHSKPVRFFDFIDLLAEYLFNANKLFDERKKNWKSIHQVYENKERKLYPYYWFLTRDEAATMIQALVRGFLVRRNIYSKANKENTSLKSLGSLDGKLQKEA